LDPSSLSWVAEGAHHCLELAPGVARFDRTRLISETAHVGEVLGEHLSDLLGGAAAEQQRETVDLLGVGVGRGDALEDFREALAARFDAEQVFDLPLEGGVVGAGQDLTQATGDGTGGLSGGAGDPRDEGADVSDVEASVGSEGADVGDGGQDVGQRPTGLTGEERELVFEVG
jgi:hypothetical protein